MILPPRVLEVRTHASIENVCGAATVFDVEARPPLKVTAVLGSFGIAPATLRVAEPLRVSGRDPMGSAKVPLASPSRQWSTRPAVARIASPYVLRTPLLLTFTVIVCDRWARSTTRRSARDPAAARR
jgi:hypothetical protein